MVIAFAAKNEAAGVGALLYYNAHGLIVNIAKQNTKLISLSKIPVHVYIFVSLTIDSQECQQNLPYLIVMICLENNVFG